jgi:hypothetical protein
LLHNQGDLKIETLMYILEEEIDDVQQTPSFENHVIPHIIEV